MSDQRFDLAFERICEIPDEAKTNIPSPYADWFVHEAKEIRTFVDTVTKIQEEGTALSLSQLQDLNTALYQDSLPEHYGESYVNPARSCKAFGKEMGQLLSAAAFEFRSMILYLSTGRKDRALIRMELFLELYSAFRDRGALKEKHLRQILYGYLFDYMEEEMEDNLTTALTDEGSSLLSWLMESDLSGEAYLYLPCVYISDNERYAAKTLASFSEEKIDTMTRPFTEGYKKGFVLTGKDFDGKKTIGLLGCFGFERMLRRAVESFEDMGKTSLVFANPDTLFPVTRRAGLLSTDPNRQESYDHAEDLSLFLDDALQQRIVESMENVTRRHAATMHVYGGPAVQESFGLSPFTPNDSEGRAVFSDRQQEKVSRMRQTMSRLYNDAVDGRNRSFTIIDYPVIAVTDGLDTKRYEQIFDAVISINSLDSDKYAAMQQALVDALNRADRMHVTGRGENKTDLVVNLYKLKDPDREDIFENCVADVNIPVGEVFTSPVLQGTDGVLNVRHCALEGMLFENLTLTFKDGWVVDYSCDNFKGQENEEEKGRALIEENILFHHRSLPMGEAAIGTNTTAYALGKKFGILSRYPILIGEKTGPHFAVGDTCYSNEEDNEVFNLDGKKIVAKENEHSRKRLEDPVGAYFGCHTDITIPYDELGCIEALTKDGRGTVLIRDGRFVLPGTEGLNEGFLLA